MHQKPPIAPDEPIDKRSAANRENSKKSTGPSEAGKPASSLNALKFGFFSKKALLPDESWEEFIEFHAQLLNEFVPRNSLERHVVEQYVSLAWRVKRLPEIEAGAFARYGISVQGNQCGSAFAMVASVQGDDILGQLARYEATLRKGMFKAMDLLRSLRKDGWGGDTVPILDAEVVTLSSGADNQSCPQSNGSPTTQSNRDQLVTD